MRSCATHSAARAFPVNEMQSCPGSFAFVGLGVLKALTVFPRWEVLLCVHVCARAHAHVCVRVLHMCLLQCARMCMCPCMLPQYNFGCRQSASHVHLGTYTRSTHECSIMRAYIFAYAQVAVFLILYQTVCLAVWDGLREIDRVGLNNLVTTSERATAAVSIIAMVLFSSHAVFRIP